MAKRTQIVHAIPTMASQLFGRFARFSHRFDSRRNKPAECPNRRSKTVFRTVPCCHLVRDFWRWKYALAWPRAHVLRRILEWPPARGGAHLVPIRGVFCCALGREF